MCYGRQFIFRLELLILESYSSILNSVFKKLCLCVNSRLKVGLQGRFCSRLHINFNSNKIVKGRDAHTSRASSLADWLDGCSVVSRYGPSRTCIISELRPSVHEDGCAF
jgi:hypothetical protein